MAITTNSSIRVNARVRNRLAVFILNRRASVIIQDEFHHGRVTFLDQVCAGQNVAAIQAISANLALGFRPINSHAEVNSSIPPYKSNIQRWEIEKKRSGWSKTAVGLTAVIRLNAAATKKVIAA